MLSSRVAAPRPVYQEAQVLVPFAWRLATTLPQPLPLLSCVYVNPKLVPREEAEAEIWTLLESFPYPLAIEDLPELQAILKHVREDEGVPGFQPHEAALVFYLAYLKQETLYLRWTAAHHPTLTLLFYHQLCAQASSAALTMREVIILCIRYDLQDRYDICRRFVLQAPSYAPAALRDWMILFLGHYNRRWVRAFTKQLRIRHPERIQTLVRHDISIYCQALARLIPPPSPSEYVRRFQGRLAPTPRDSSPQQAIAYCSKYPIQVWQIMGWTCTLEEQKRLTEMADEGFGPTLAEALDICECFL